MTNKMSDLQEILKFASGQSRIPPNKSKADPQRKNFSGRRTSRLRVVSVTQTVVLITQGWTEVPNAQCDMVLYRRAVRVPFGVFSSVHTRSGPFSMAARSLETQYITGLTNYMRKWISIHFIMRPARLRWTENRDEHVD